MKNFKIIIGFLLMFVLTVGLFGCNIAPETGEDDTIEEFKVTNAYVTIDINPSIEIITGEDGLVVQVNALNDDAQVLLVDTNFTGKTVDEVVDAIVALAAELGYIDYDSENAIVVTAEAETVEETENLENKIQERINNFAQARNCAMQVIRASNQATAELKAEAEALNVSIGKLKLIKLAQEFDATLTDEAAAEMPVKDLNRVIMNARVEMKNFMSEELRRNYLQLRQQLRDSFFIERVQVIYDEMILADDATFTTVLENSTATVQEVKDLYKNYLDELLALENPTEEPTVDPTLEAQINGLKAQKEVLNQLINQLTAQFRELTKNSENFELIRDQLRAKMEEMNTLNQQIANLVQQAMNQSGAGVNVDFGYENGQFQFRFQLGLYAKYLEIRNKYVTSFSEIGVDLDALEELFVDAIEEQLNQIRNQIETQLQEVRTGVSEKVAEIIASYREQNKLCKDLSGQDTDTETDPEE